MYYDVLMFLEKWLWRARRRRVREKIETYNQRQSYTKNLRERKEGKSFTQIFSAEKDKQGDDEDADVDERTHNFLIPKTPKKMVKIFHTHPTWNVNTLLSRWVGGERYDWWQMDELCVHGVKII